MGDNSSEKPTKKKKVPVIATPTVLSDGMVIPGRHDMEQEESPRNTTSAPSVEQDGQSSHTPAFREEIRAILAESEIRAMPVLSLEKTCPTAVTSRSSPVIEHSTVRLVSETDSDPEEPFILSVSVHKKCSITGV